jgi:micrococcal nuclease
MYNKKEILMKKIVTIIAALSCSVVFANPYSYKITRVIDGDTVEFQADFMPDPLPKKLSIRVLGVDTPEKGHRASCPQEAVAAEKASQFTKDSLNNAIKAKQPVLIEIQKHDKYGGRVLGDVLINGQKLSAMLIANGHARVYHGKKKSSWCN